MHHEYAVEPAAIGSSWETFRYLIEKFGFQEGRLISRFPGRWASDVIDAAKAAGVPEVARARIIEKLRQKKRSVLMKTGRAYEPALQSWLENALASHAARPFRAIIAEEERTENEVISPVELDADHPLMAAPASRNVPRTARHISGACSVLLCAAREIDLVDPYFDLANHGGDYRGPLELMMRSMYMTGKASVKIRIHYRDHDSRPTVAQMLERVGGWTNGIVPPGFELHLYRWLEHENGEDMHDRYLLCDCGGLTIGAGFAALGGQENATISRLDDTHVQELRRRFIDGSNVYIQVGSAIRIKSNGDADLF